MINVISDSVYICLVIISRRMEGAEEEEVCASSSSDTNKNVKKPGNKKVNYLDIYS